MPRDSSRRHKVPGTTDRAARHAGRWLDRAPLQERPFYLQLTVLIDPHMPRPVPRRRRDPARRSRCVRALALRDLDDALKALFEGARRARACRGDTLWVFVADHGEGLSLPPHHRPARTANGCISSTVEIPWIVWGPQHAGGWRGGRASRAGVDVSATVLGLVGLPKGGAAGTRLVWAGTRRWGGTHRSQRTVAHSASHVPGRRRCRFVDHAHWQCQSGYGPFAATTPTEFLRGCFDRRAKTRGSSARFRRSCRGSSALDAWRAEHASPEAQSRRDRSMPEVDPRLQPPIGDSRVS